MSKARVLKPMILGTLMVVLFVGGVSHAAEGQAEGTIYAALASQTRVWAGAGWQTGNFRYKIGGRTHSEGETYYNNDPLSELQFPIDSYMVRLGANHRFADRWELRGHLGLTPNQHSGLLKDSDWTWESSPRVKTDYSESDCRVSGWEIDLGGRYWFSPLSLGGASELTFGLGLGMTYQNFRWDAREGTQTSLLDDGRSVSVHWNEPVISYAVDAYMPYLEALAAWQRGGFRFQAAAGLSPWLRIRDEDFHVLRDKYNASRSDGWGWRLSAEGRYDFTSHWHAAFSAETLWLRAEGAQHQSFHSGAYEGLNSEIDETIYSRQTRLLLSTGYRF